MTVKEWHDFNHNSDFSWSIGDYIVKVFRHKSYEKKDIMLTGTVDDKDLCRMFGDYKLIFISRGNYQDTDNGVKIVLGIYPDDENEGAE